jgi:acetyl esterase/lipase
LVATAARAAARKPSGTNVRGVRLGSVVGERVDGSNARAGYALLYFHGGGFCIGSPLMHRSIAAHLARHSAMSVFVPAYRLAPEDPYPAALQDALTAYRALLAGGYAPERIALVGDSAGGGLALALLLALRDAGIALPASAVLLSPWVDLSLSGASIAFNAADDPVVSPVWLASCARAYAGTLAPSDPRVSPLFAALHGLPPLGIYVGTREVLLDDAARLAVVARDAGVRVELRRYDGLWHNWQFQAGVLPSVTPTFADAADFVEAAFALTTSAVPQA